MVEPIRNSWRSALTGIAALAAATLPAAADDQPTMGEAFVAADRGLVATEDQPTGHIERDFIGQAGNWSLNNIGIAVAITLTEDSPVDAAQLESDVRGILASQSPPIPFEVFFDDGVNNSRSMMSFFIHGVERGPYGLRDAPQGLMTALTEIRGLQQAAFEDNQPEPQG